MNNCLTCKGHYKECIGKPWYTYGDIRWCVWQIVWIIEHSESLVEGIWPYNPDEASHSECFVESNYHGEANFVRSVIAVAEVNARLKPIGMQGKLLVAEVKAGMELSPEAREVLLYIKGFRRKRTGFLEWRKQAKYRGDSMPRFSGKQELSKKQKQERAKRKKNSRR